MKSLENKLPPPFVTLAIGAAMWGMARFEPPIVIEPNLHYALTGLIGLLGLIVGPTGALEFRRRKTTINPVQINQASQVVTTGIFRFTRNPMYVGLTALLLTWAVWLAVPWTLLGPVIFALFTHHFQILPEERVMSAKFGREYDEYRQRVRRWL
jgi:protein-S-isoprenylcysteine O-methyltransferase Ste14